MLSKVTYAKQGTKRALRRLRGRRQLAVVVALGVVALTVAVMMSPWALVLWGAGIMVAVGTDVVKGALQRQAQGALAPSSPLTVTVRLDVGNYVHIPAEIGAHVVPRSGHGVHVTIETNSTQAVILHRMVPVVVSHGSLPPEARPIPHWGVVPVRNFDLWLSEDPPRISISGGPDFPYKVMAEDPEIFVATVHATGSYVRWHLELAWSCNGREGIHRIDIDGEPFQTVGLAEDT